MKFTHFTLALAATAMLWSCQSSGEKQGMEQFAGDTAFQAAHEPPDSIQFQGKGSNIEFPAADGKKAFAYSVKSATPSTDFLFVIQEWWGVNDQIRQEADRLQAELPNVNVLAIDLYDGKSTADPEEAGKLMGEASEERIRAILQGALDYAGADARIATIGWCFGGGWSLRSSIMSGNRGAGCVIYYGMPVEKASEIAPLQADVLGIFAKQDDWINEPVVKKFQMLAKATNKNLLVKWFDAQHAFANPSNPRYDEQAAKEANALALAFLRERLQ